MYSYISSQDSHSKEHGKDTLTCNKPPAFIIMNKNNIATQSGKNTIVHCVGFNNCHTKLIFAEFLSGLQKPSAVPGEQAAWRWPFWQTECEEQTHEYLLPRLQVICSHYFYISVTPVLTARSLLCHCVSCRLLFWISTYRSWWMVWQPRSFVPTTPPSPSSSS